MDFVDVLVIVLLIVAAVAAYFVFAMRGQQPSPEPAIVRGGGLRFKAVSDRPSIARPVPETAAPAGESSVAAAEPPPLFDLGIEAPVPAAPGEIRWCRQFDSRSDTLDDTARLRLIGDLGVIAKEWCVPLLAQAYQEEQRRSHRQAALISLTACHSRAAAGTFRAALAAGDPSERAIAADGLADLEPLPQTKVRRTVERF
jgi:hypothetical protein